MPIFHIQPVRECLGNYLLTEAQPHKVCKLYVESSLAGRLKSDVDACVLRSVFAKRPACAGKRMDLS